MTDRRRRAELGLTETDEFLDRAGEVDPRLGVLLRIARSLSTELHERAAVLAIMAGVNELLGADRTTLYLLTPDGAALRSHVAIGDELIEIRLPIGEGMAGWVAKTGRDLIVRDAYLDPRFDPAWDVRFGYRTRSVLCQPIRDRNGNLLGVAQAINKSDGYFTVDDASMMRTVMAIAAIVLANQDLTNGLMLRNMELKNARTALEARVREIDLLFQIEREVGAAETLERAIELALRALQRALSRDAAVLTLAREGGAVSAFRLFGAADNAIERVDRERWSGFAGRVLGAGAARALCGQAGGDDALLAAEEGLPFVPTAGLTLPLIGEGEVLGALGLYSDDVTTTCFEERDIKLMTVAAASLGRILARHLARAAEEQSARLAALGQTLSMVLHDFRTPMTIASGYVQMMAGADDPARRQELADAALRQLERVVQMSREVLDFARGRGELLVQKVLLADFAAELRELCEQIFAGHEVSVEIDVQERGAARLDRFKLLRVVQNLARNAREALTDRATGQAKGRFRVTIASEGEALILRFADDGPGVPAAFQPRLFAAFASHGKADGTGLGLAMVKNFAESHGGSVAYAETPGGGATFIVRLPRQGPAPATDPPAKS
jgi:signal transduction histidine kinase